MATPKKITSITGRTSAGRFAEGNAGGPGRPCRTTELTYLRILAEACPPEKFKEVVESAIESAKAGDSKAREWLGGYLCGSPDGKAAMLSNLHTAELQQELAERQAAVDRASSEEMLRLQESLYLR
jgi:hypothetical protein